MRRGVTISHGASRAQVQELFGFVAKLTPSGWVIPKWAIDMYQAAKK